MKRSTSRSIIRAGLPLLPFLLLPVCSAAPAQSSLQPPPRKDAQPAAQDDPGVTLPAGTSSDQDDPLHTASRTELDVVKVLVAQEHAWNSGDIDGFLKGYKDSPDTIFIGRQISRGYQQILTDYQHDYTTRASMGTLVYSDLQVTPLRDTLAICTGRYHLDRGKKDGGPADGLFSLVLEKTADGWKIILDHTT